MDTVHNRPANGSTGAATNHTGRPLLRKPSAQSPWGLRARVPHATGAPAPTPRHTAGRETPKRPPGVTPQPGTPWARAAPPPAGHTDTKLASRRGGGGTQPPRLPRRHERGAPTVGPPAQGTCVRLGLKLHSFCFAFRFPLSPK